MDRVFLDANVLFSAAYSENSRLRELWRRKNITLVTSSYAAEEARRNLDVPKHKAELEKLLKTTAVVPTVHKSLINPLPPEAKGLHDKDVPILLGAISARASHLLTGDFTHFGPYFGKTLAGVRILPPAEYLNLPSPSGEQDL
ncbi:MAG: PIN domain-containing protein [Nitrospinae bacterium]|nr:PIN domain-containing protein [Nitrospinota bacterium]